MPPPPTLTPRCAYTSLRARSLHRLLRGSSHARVPAAAPPGCCPTAARSAHGTGQLRSYSTMFSPPSEFSTFGATPTVLSKYLDMTPAPLTFSSLLQHAPLPGKQMTNSQLIESAEFTREQLPIRLARRVGGFRSLPFIVGSNPYIQQIARLYSQSFETLSQFPPIRTLEHQQEFVRILEGLVEDHAPTIPTLARGFLECRKYMDPADVSAFLDAAIHSRVAIRLIAEQHLALAASFNHSTRIETQPTGMPALSSSLQGKHSNSVIGVVDTKLNPAEMVQTCASFVHGLCESTLGMAPDLIMEGDSTSTYIGIPVHLEYVMTELLKNSYRATTEHWLKRDDPEIPLPPVQVTIARSDQHMSIRIRDRGGGISPQDLPNVFSYAFTTVSDPADEDQEEISGPYAMQAHAGAGGDPLGDMGSGLTSGLGTLAGLGYGLPMSRIYVTYFGGGSALDIVSLYGYGCDTFIKLQDGLGLSQTADTGALHEIHQ